MEQPPNSNRLPSGPDRRGLTGYGVGFGELVLVVAAGIALAPLGWALALAVSAGPSPWSAFFRALAAAPLARYLLNSLLVSGVTALGQVAVATPAAYVFARLRFPGRDGLFALYLGTLIIPHHVTLLPAFLLMRWLGWLDHYQALVVPALAHPFALFVLRQFFLSVPPELEDAARMDGCSRWMVLLRVLLPLSRPALVTVGLFSFLWSWNSFLWPLVVLQTPTRYTLPVGLAMLQSEVGTDWPVLMAAALIAATPVLLLFLFAQRSLVHSITFAEGST